MAINAAIDKNAWMAIAPKTCYNTPKYSREVGALGALDAPNSVLARVFFVLLRRLPRSFHRSCSVHARNENGGRAECYLLGNECLGSWNFSLREN